jgi:hypothetical protein
MDEALGHKLARSIVTSLRVDFVLKYIRSSWMASPNLMMLAVKDCIGEQGTGDR